MDNNGEQMKKAQDDENAYQEIQWLKNTIEDLLKIKYPHKKQKSQREKEARIYLYNELKKYISAFNVKDNIEIHYKSINELSKIDLTKIIKISLYYSCDPLIEFLVKKQIKGSILLQEYAIDYIKEKLCANDYKWIAYFDCSKGASFKTYIQKFIEHRITDFIRQNKNQHKIVSLDHNSEHDIGYSIKFDLNRQLYSNTNEDGYYREGIAFESRHYKEQLITLINAVIGENSEEDKKKLLNNAIYYQLKEYLQLSHKQIAFLKAYYQHELTLKDIGRLPGMNMSISQAYAFYKKTENTVRQAFKKAGVFSDIIDFLGEKNTKINIAVQHSDLAINVKRILTIHKTTPQSCSCLFLHKPPENMLLDDKAQQGSIQQAYKILQRQDFFCRFTRVDAHTAVADEYIEYIAKTCKKSPKYHIKMLYWNCRIKIAKRYQEEIIDTFHTKIRH